MERKLEEWKPVRKMLQELMRISMSDVIRELIRREGPEKYLAYTISKFW